MMMKASVTHLFFLLFFCTSSIFAQNDHLFFKLQLMPDAGSWGVYVKAHESISPSANTITGSAQVTIVVPTGFEISSIVNVAGLWTNNAAAENPIENPGSTYLSFGLVNDNPPINYSNGETLLFKIYSQSACPDTLHLIENGEDPFDQLPNSMNTNPGNEISVIDFGAGAMIYNYTGNYAPSAWSCHDCDGDGIPNALEDTNGDGQWTPGVDVSPLCGEPGTGCTAPTFLTHPQNVSTCDGNAAGFTAQAGGNARQWQVSTDGGGTWSGLSDNGTFTGTATDTLIIISTSGLHGHLFRLQASEDTCSTVSQAAEILLEGPVSFLAHPANANACPGSGAVFEAQVGAPNGTPVYQWQTSNNGITWMDIDANTQNGVYTGFDDKTLSISDVGSLNGHRYRLRASTDLCGAVFSQTTTLSVGPALSFSHHPSDYFTCGNTPFLFTARIDPASTGISQVKYQWQVSTDGGDTWSDLPNALPFAGVSNDTLLIIDNTGMNGHQFRVLAWAGDCPAVASNVATLEIGSELAILSQPQSGAFCPVGQACFSVALSGQSGSPAFQWQIQSPDLDVWQNLSDNFIFSGAGTAQLCIQHPLPVAGASFRAVIATDCGTLISEPALLEINDDLAIAAQPEGMSICEGEGAAFAAKLQRECGFTAVTFHWETTTNGTDFEEAANSFDDPYILDSLNTTGQIFLNIPPDGTAHGSGYRLRIKTPSQEYFTETAWLRVEGPPAFDLQPASLTACAGSEATLLAHAISGIGDIFYQWEFSVDGLVWVEIPADDFFGETTSNALHISDVSGVDTKYFRCKARTGACVWTYSETATLTVEGPLSFSLQPADIAVCQGSTAVFSVGVENQSGQGVVQYQWDISNDNGLTWIQGWIYSGVDSSTIAFPAANHFSGKLFRCRARTGACEWVVSEAAMLTTEQISVSLQPVSVTTCPDDGHTFEATIGATFPVGLGLDFLQWQMSGDGGGSWSYISENQPTGYGGTFTGTQTTALDISLTDGLGGHLFRLTGATSLCETSTSPASLNLEDDLCPDPIEYDCLGMKIQWLPSQQRWGVFVRPEGFTPPAYNTASSGRVTIAAPVDFTYTGLISHAGGAWKPGTVMFNPPQAPGMQYMTFDLTPNNNQLLLTSGEEIMLFSFAKVGPCPASLQLMDDYVPFPLLPNELTGTGLGLGFGPDVHFHLCGVYDRNAWNCQQGQALGFVNGPAGGQTASAEAAGLFQISPNPATDWLQVSFKNDWPADHTTLRLMNLHGQVLHIENLAGQAQHLRLDLSHLQTGVYFLTMEVDGKVVQREKVVKH